MPKFVLNKIVRDNLREEYERMNQTATYRQLSKAEHTEALRQKIIEEADELATDAGPAEILAELRDIQQAIDDLATLQGISSEQIRIAVKEKFEKKGGFAGGAFVETLDLTDDDEWVAYYRSHPDTFKEVKQ